MNERLHRPYYIYLLAISLAGGILILLALSQANDYQPFNQFILFLLLAVFAQFATTSVSLYDKTSITYQVAPAICIAAIPFFGPLGAVLIDVATAVTLWLIKPSEKKTWKKSLPQLTFNVGMSSLAMILSGLAFIFTRNLLGPASFAGQLVPWFAAALVNDQVNLWILAGIIWLQHDRKISPTQIWKDNLWAMPISILLMSVGGGMLALSFDLFGTIGLIIFFLPILLSFFAFRLYVRKIQDHMDNLELMVEERTAELAASIKRKDALITVLTHDMITPLTSTQLYAELIKENPHITLENPDLIDTMLHSQNTLLNLVRNILDIERLQSDGSLPLHKENFDLTQLISCSVGMVNVLAKEKDITITFQPEIEPMTLRADRQQIGRVLLNLLTNAVKYTPSGGMINAVSQIKNGQIIIEVKDTGYGIPANELATIFDRFSEVIQRREKATGTGLGLAITKALIENHNGQITVQSEEGKGSTFTINLPAN